MPEGPPDDAFEPNDTSDTATNFGTLTGSQALSGTINRHFVNGFLVFDQDWFRWTAGQSGTFTATLDSIQAGGGDLHERVFALLPNNSLQLLRSSTPTGGVPTQTISVSTQAGEQLFVWVYGFNFALGTYNLTVGLA